MLALAPILQAHAGWRAAVYLGAATTHATDLTIEQPSLGTRLHVRNVTFEGHSFTPPLYYGMRLGRAFGRFGVEAEFIHQKIYARTERTVQITGQARGATVSGAMPMNTLVPEFSISHGLNYLLANFTLEQPLASRVSFCARVGAGGTLPHAESNIMGDSRQGYQLGKPALQAAAGFTFQLWRGLDWLTEYKFTRTRQRVKVVAGDAETLVLSHHMVFGLGLRF